MTVFYIIFVFCYHRSLCTSPDIEKKNIINHESLLVNQILRRPNKMRRADFERTVQIAIKPNRSVPKCQFHILKWISLKC